MAYWLTQFLDDVDNFVTQVRHCLKVIKSRDFIPTYKQRWKSFATYLLTIQLIDSVSIMPRFKSVTKLETLSLNQFCKICAITCTSLEEKADDSQQPSTLDAEGKFKSFLILLPRQILEQVITKTLTIITSEVRKKRSHKGLIKAIECLPQRSVQKLDCASLYSQVRLYGHVNSRCVF
jgi:hypothetical protein